MSKIDKIYPLAVEKTKEKIQEDITKYLEAKPEMPDFNEYIEERKSFIEQIWVNIWLNKAGSSASKAEKKAFLAERGYDVEGMERKLINTLFRTQLKEYEPFQGHEWLTNLYSKHEGKWKEKYIKARKKFLEREREKREKDERNKLQKDIQREAAKIIDVNKTLFYLHLRYFIAGELVNDLTKNPKYQSTDIYMIEEKLIQVGFFNSSDYRKVSDFFQELTGDVHHANFQHGFDWVYETYEDAYERFVEQFLSEHITSLVQERLSPPFMEGIKELKTPPLKYILYSQLSELQEDYMEQIKDEYMEDLLKLANVPFDEKIHQEIYEKDLLEREKRYEEELRELERQLEAERRMMEDIFGREYNPSVGRNIKYVLHIGETNTGKTHQALKRMKEADTGLYLAPLRLLALEVYDKLNSEEVPCNLKTGEEEKEVEGANHISCTVEMFYEKEFYDVIVIDEAQMIADKDRGFSWYKAITKANAQEVHIIGSRNSKNMILQLLGDSRIEINEYSRDIPLQVEQQPFKIKQTEKGDALVCFSRKRVLETASQLQGSGYSVSMIYGSMPPETRKKQIQRFIDGETTVIVATDAIGMGLNLPIRRIVFLENEKFDGTRRRRLTSQEVKQIAGRAGRKGLYNVGKVAFMKEINLMARLLDQEDELVHTFAIAPTNAIFERFQKYHRDLGTFFELWDQFESPKGTKKASLSEERELYELVRDTEIEGRLTMMDLYGFLHLPFSKKDHQLIKQWLETMETIVKGKELPEPIIKGDSLEDLELSYKAIGLHLLFLYRLGKRTEAIYWERLREEISDDVHEALKTNVKRAKKCKKCGRKLPWEFNFPICDACHHTRVRRRRHYYEY
ncbi:ATP-dependent RNA helicase SUPV3L1/SUV3 [Evansella vedderi]|uniref:ATP-dependent RNA helicase SUPV3L1/SUV3 n=1 Tax=Evansella vedderi TaxID=38282 RepID=A0ABU0A343_9BACI|nr:DEAD/DEAH box helicase [Evansella vedderi]MDQ0257909.1 ATP-dependent RNA helicase SUPV3L1/SUV3 [Evansella vedderi]